MWIMWTSSSTSIESLFFLCFFGFRQLLKENWWRNSQLWDTSPGQHLKIHPINQATAEKKMKCPWLIRCFIFFFLNVLDWSAEHDIRFCLLLYVLPEISNFHWWVNLVLITCVLILFPSLEVGLVGRVYPSDHDIDGHATDSWLSRSHHLDYCFRAPNIFFLFYLVLIFFFH